jgi:hypothetical protein
MGVFVKRFFEHGCVRILPAVLLVGLVLAYTPPANAGGVVSTCDETNLLMAMSGGGTITFTCSGTISLISVPSIPISSDTTVDGTGQNVTITSSVPIIFEVF